MAAVALTLAEISNIATKMAPAALAAMKTGAPTVFALLAAPQFLIAVGVGVGLTVVMFGGYKIVKKITAANDERKRAKEEGMDEMLDVEELSRIEVWRRGIADSDVNADNASVVSGATSVEGEFITPFAARSMGHLPSQASGRKKSKKDKEKEKSKEEKAEKKDKKSKKKDREGSLVGSEVSKASSRRSGEDQLALPAPDTGTSSGTGIGSGIGSGIGNLRDRALIKVKKPSPLRRMFRSGEGSSVAS